VAEADARAEPVRDSLILCSILGGVGKGEASERVEGAGRDLADGGCRIGGRCRRGYAADRGRIETVDHAAQFVLEGRLVVVTHAKVDRNVVRYPPVVLDKEGKVNRVEVCGRGVEDAAADWQSQEEAGFGASERWGAA
jgi:hypothetical protein